MRSLLIFGLMAALVSPCDAADKMTVSQLEQLIAQRVVQGHPAPKKQATQAPDEIQVDVSDGQLLHQLDQDDELVPQLQATELTERLSILTLYRLVGKYNLGPHAQLALEQLADRSALLNLPIAEKIPQPPPDAAAQSKMLSASRSYVLRELSHLPNFVAMQTTTRFDNSPATLKYYQAQADHEGFHRVGTVQRQITFREGREVVDTTNGVPAAKQKESRLDSRGEFGTEAAVVLMDLEEGSTLFDHWEQTMGGPAAVYRFSVPREFSHYEVSDQCQEHTSFHDTPGYHGELAIDPRTGAILRMMLEADSRSNDPVSHVASVVEYGPIVLGNQRSFCPLRSLTFMVEEANGCAHGRQKLEKPVAMINQTIFSNYHRFGTSATMIFHEADNERPSPENTPGKPAENEKGLSAAPAVSGQSKRP